MPALEGRYFIFIFVGVQLISLVKDCYATKHFRYFG